MIKSDVPNIRRNCGERRSLTRIMMNKAASIYDGKQQYLLTAEIINFSLNGVLLECGETGFFTPGDRLDVIFDLSGDATPCCVEISCNLIRKTENTLALKYEIIDYDSLMAAKEYISTHSGSPHAIEKEFIRFLTLCDSRITKIGRQDAV
jgi:hypothetical protein